MEKFFDKLIELLKRDERFFADDGDYKIWDLRFFNRKNLQNFDSEFRTLLKIDR
ncbi:MAG: hypothetical protein IJQ85_05960 [Selenomonadaceae bacterium]|nr:hypothetical protein [Selenomonadaceae bacterium]